MIVNSIKYIISRIYLLIIYIRYWLYKSSFLGSTHFSLPVICIGNLSVGGTGKTPMVAYLIELLQQEYKIGVISRGYKRKTSGFVKVKTTHQSEDVGDEPLLLKLKYPYTEVAVGEQRIYAIPRLLSLAPDVQTIIMDDGFQHLSVKAQLNILLTTYQNPFWNDKILPLGSLREPIQAKERADIIIVSNCKPTIANDEMLQLEQKINPTPHQKVFFSYIQYNTIYALFHNHSIPDEQLILITGIANSASIYSHLNSNHNIQHYEYNDHHHYTTQDFEEILAEEKSKNWITTEKDAVKFLPHKAWFEEKQINIWVQPIQIKIKSSNSQTFEQTIKAYLDYYFTNKY